MTQALTRGREAFDRRSWEEAFQELSAAEEETALDSTDLERLADAAWWSGRGDESAEALERAYLAHVQAGENTRASAMAIRLAERAVRSGQGPVGQGWLARAGRLLQDEPESAAHAWHEFMQGAEALVARRDFEQAIAHSERAIQLGTAHGDPDVVNIAMSFKGAALTKMGRVDEGLALIDEAAAAATSGELRAKTACDVYCFTIAACRDVSDLRRATEWTEQAEKYMQRLAIKGYPGACKVHRAELKRLQGRWTEAEEEARAACDELERFRLMDVLGAAYNEIGEVRLRVGDLVNAEEAFLKAYECGTDPQPGLALVHLARGEADEAARSIERSLHKSMEDSGFDLVARVQMLPAKVEIDLAVGDVDGARSAVEELEQIAIEHENSIWTAAAATARGSLDLSEGRTEEAVDRLDAAWRQWQSLDFPYEGAKARTTLGLARRTGGDEGGARLELNAALSVFRRLGATPDIARVEGLLVEPEVEVEKSVLNRAFMFTDIVTSTDLIGLIGDSAWTDLLRWHDRTLEEAFAARGGEVVNHTGDGFFVAFEEASNAIHCAVEIQRTLHRHRLDHGFAPSIRIGIHTSDATHSEGNYFGRGVHVAARVAALGDGEDIVISTGTLAGVGEIPYSTSAARTVALKGVVEPVEVRTIDWR